MRASPLGPQFMGAREAGNGWFAAFLILILQACLSFVFHVLAR